jgi:cytochrome c
MIGQRRLVLILLTVLAFATAALLVAGPLRGQEPPSDAAKALTKAVEQGNALFRDATFGTNGRSCMKCHENPAKPAMNLKTRVGDFPKWDKREARVITLGQKMNQMIVRMLKGEAEALGSEKLVAIEAYLMSISRQGE